MSTNRSSTQNNPGGRFEIAFTKTAKARAALEPASFMPINLDIQLTVTIVLGALPRMRALRDTIAEHLPLFDIAQFDKLETYAEALAYAQTVYLAASEPAEALPSLVARAVELRDQLVADATALARRNLVDGRALAELKGGNGYLNVGSDVGVIVRMLRERWADIKGKTAIQLEELDEAEQLFERITVAYAERSQQPARAAGASEDRVRAFTMVVDAYDQARRAISYVRWQEDDLEKFAPSLWSGRGTRSGAATAKPADPGGTPAPTPAPTPTPTAGSGTPAEPTTPAAPGTPGMPGGLPFVNN